MSEKLTYPKITRKIWWLLRNRLKQSMPGTITPTLIASVSQMTDESARANVIGPLRELSLIGDDNKPTEVMERWRHDDEYQTVCHEIRAKLYPEELIEAFPDPTSDHKDRIRNWFMKNAKVGDTAARMYADTYILLSEADPAKAGETQPRVKVEGKPTKASAVKSHSTSKRAAAASAQAASESAEQLERRIKGGKGFPSIHIDVQVHISPDTSAEQIDKIFESMSKHLAKFTE